jgi:hypothetical protein
MITVRRVSLATENRQDNVADARQGQAAVTIGTAAQVDEMQAASPSSNCLVVDEDSINISVALAGTSLTHRLLFRPSCTDTHAG